MKRAVLFVFSLLLLFAVCIPKASAGWVDDDYATCVESAEDGSVCSGAYASHSQTSILSDWVRRLMGPVPGITVTADAWQRNPEYVRKMAQGAATSQMSGMIGMLYSSPPANTYAFVRDTAQNLGFIPRQAYAQGVGFSGLAPLLPIWKAFRNVAYLLLALVMVVIGFMVMLRKKIDPKTVVTVQNALPRIVVALLLITFSYAIVGIMVDMMYLVILLAMGIFKSAGVLPAITEAGKALGNSTEQSLYTEGGILANLFNIFGIPATDGTITPTDLVWRALGLDPGIAKGVSTALVIGGIIVAALAPATAGGSGVIGLTMSLLGLAGPLLGFLIGLALLFLTIRLFIFFLGSYIQIILALIFAPLQLVMEAVPGSSTFSDWIKNLFANLIVFPIGAIIFMLSGYFASIANQGGGGMWAPPFVPFGSSASSISALISIGILFTIPTLAGQIKESLKPKPFVDAGVGGLLGSFSAPANILMQGWHFYTSHQTMKYMRGQLPPGMKGADEKH